MLLFLLTMGVMLTWPALLGEDFSAYTGRVWAVVIVCGISGVMGQFAITLAFRHVKALTGSVLGLSRVVMVAVIGTVWLGEGLTWRTVVGGAVLMGSILLLGGGRRGKN